MNISLTKAAKEWGISRTTIYQKLNDGQLSRTADKKIDTAEMLRVFGEPLFKKRTEQSINSPSSTQLNSQTYKKLEHQLELESLKNEHLRQQISDQKHLIENYQQQISQLNTTLAKANASIRDFAQVRLLEFKQFETDNGQELEQKQNVPTATISKKKRKRWFF